MSRRKELWKQSLLQMKQSLLSTYDLNTTAEEEERFIKAWSGHGDRYVIFSGYRRNEGRKRILDIADVIDRAIADIETREDREASRLYIETLRSVALCSNWARVLEYSTQMTTET
ncbi:MAG: hypothetical protein QXQ81_03305 [Candidatus Thorarchaeota archaeon]